MVSVLIIALIVAFVIRLVLFFRIKAKADDIRKDLDAPALMPPLMATSRLTIDQLPNIISAHHHGIPPALAAEKMRLLYIERVLEWPAGLKVFEDVDTASDCLVIPYAEVSEEQWAKTMVLTWRWGKPKPRPHAVPGFSPMNDDQWSELLELMRCGQEAGMELIWIDCECTLS